MIDYKFNGIVTKIVDGGTIEVDVDLGFSVWSKQRFRLFGIEVPVELDDNAKQYLEDRISGNAVVIQSYKTDVYGHHLGVIYFENSNINEELVDVGLATIHSEIKK